jgi:glutamate dehydrogenase/leucine dehydrogenase
MLPDISLREMTLLARAMSYKMAWLDLNAAGAKSGIWFDAAGQDREAVLRAFGQAAAPLLQSRAYMCGVDMGTSFEDIELIRAEAGLEPEADSLANKRLGGLTMDELVTGFGVIKSARRAAALTGRRLEKCTLAIEGFGKVGAGCLRQAAEEGLRVVAISTLAGTRYDARAWTPSACSACGRSAATRRWCAIPTASCCPRRSALPAVGGCPYPRQPRTPSPPTWPAPSPPRSSCRRPTCPSRRKRTPSSTGDE